MRHWYSLFMILLTPVLLVRLWWKGRRLVAYRQRINERFALNTMQPADLWVHAVSLGEVVAVTPLVDAFLERKWRVLITTMTPTGSERVQKQFGNRVAHQYLPYDIPWLLQRFFNQVNPRFGLIMETELWPNMIHCASQAKIPLYLANARLSDRSMQQYQKVAFFFKPLLAKFTGIFAQSNEDKQRFFELGAPESIVQVLGNLKFDRQINKIDSQNLQLLKQLWGETRTVVIAASTHGDEESQILGCLKKLQAAIPDVVLLIAPRHPERFQEVYQLGINAGFNTGLRSQENTLAKDNAVVVLDSLGELLAFYGLSDYAFVGGSLVPIGGHNVLEPIAAKIPVFCGKHMQNSKSICRDLLNASALQMVENADALIDAIINVHSDVRLKRSLVTNASQVLESNQGVMLRYLRVLGVLEGSVGS
jgi:3-deoxy-D-manno-octulosonic-acid transferase